MSNSVFQSVIVQLRDITDRSFGVIDTEGCVVSCTDMSILGERWTDAALKGANAADSIAKILPASRLRRGVVVSSTEAGVHVELYVVIEYGTNISAVSQNLVAQVTFALKEYARVPLDGVEVHVQGVKVRK